MKQANPTAATLGYRHPAEWERHQAVWLTWPTNPRDWPGKLGATEWAYVEIVRKLTGPGGERARIIVDSARTEARAMSRLARAGVDARSVEFFIQPTNRGWCRDMGPIFVAREGRAEGDATSGGGHSADGWTDPAIVDFGFTAWAKYSDYALDDAAAPELARRLGLSCLTPRVDGRRFVLEGGAIDLNGDGVVMTTEECLLDQKTQVRNPGMDRGAVEGALRDWLGAREVLWLGRGIAGDDTHGHIDDCCRFIDARRVVLCREPDGSDANHGALQENRERLEGVRLADGSAIEVIDLPMPEPLWFGGMRLPASYANFLIANEAVLVPTFNDARDRTALGILADCFPGREVIGISAVDLVWGLGTLHCLTHEQPAGGAV